MGAFQASLGISSIGGASERKSNMNYSDLVRLYSALHGLAVVLDRLHPGDWRRARFPPFGSGRKWRP